jgi:hypothetical protein
MKFNRILTFQVINSVIITDHSSLHLVASLELKGGRRGGAGVKPWMVKLPISMILFFFIFK